MSMDGFSPATERRRIGKLLGILLAAIVLLGTAGFFGLVGYYAWQIKFGDAEALARQFSEEFTNIPGIARNAAAPPVTAAQLASLIRPASPVRGDERAPITIVAFIDFECPYSQK